MSVAAANSAPIIPYSERRKLDLSWSDFKWPLAFMLSMSMMGLMFPLGYLLVPLILFQRFRHDRYDFIIMLMIFFGGFGLIYEGNLPFKPEDLAFVIAVILLIAYRKRGIVKRTTVLYVAYCAFIFLLATFSEERMSIQIRLMRAYFLFGCFIIPICCFNRREFDLNTFWRRLMPFIIIIWAYYIIDSFILGSYIFLPRTPINGEMSDSSFFKPIIYGFMKFERKYPMGLILTSLVIYPIARYYKLRIWQWLLFIGACLATQTFTVITGLLIGALASFINRRSILPGLVGLVGVLWVGYYVDSQLPMVERDFYFQSTLRIKSSIDQITALQEATDDEDLADFASGRMAQALPKMELVTDYHKEWTGLGFLHPKLTTNNKYIIINDLYYDAQKSEEVATGIETEVLQVYVTIGILGLLAYFLFFGGTYYIIRKYEHSRFYLTVLIMAFWNGMGAYGGLTVTTGQMIVSFAFAAVVLNQRRLEEQ